MIEQLLLNGEILKVYSFKEWFDMFVKHCEKIYLEEGEHIDTSGMCLTEDELYKYLNGKQGYAYHIEDLVIFDKPKELADFWHYKGGNLGLPNANTRLVSNITKAPQNFIFIESEE